MKVRRSMIDKELRAAGTFVKLFNNTFTENRFKLFNKLAQKNKHKMTDASLNTEIKWIDRPNGTKLRICVFSPLEQKATDFLMKSYRYAVDNYFANQPQQRGNSDDQS